MRKYILGFIAGCAVTGALLFLLSPRIGTSVLQKRDPVEISATVHVSGNPRTLIPYGNIPALLSRIAGLSEADKAAILNQINSGSLTELKLVGDEDSQSTTVIIRVSAGQILIATPGPRDPFGKK